MSCATLPCTLKRHRLIFVSVVQHRHALVSAAMRMAGTGGTCTVIGSAFTRLVGLGPSVKGGGALR